MPHRSCVIMSAVRKSFGNRKFYALPEDYAIKSSKLKSQTLVKKEDSTKLIKYIDDNIIGKNTTFAGPFGRRKGKQELTSLHLIRLSLGLFPKHGGK